MVSVYTLLLLERAAETVVAQGVCARLCTLYGARMYLALNAHVERHQLFLLLHIGHRL